MWWHRRKLTYNKKMKLRNERNSGIFSEFGKQEEDMVEFQLPQKTEESVPSVEKEDDDEISMIEEIDNNVFQEEEKEADLSEYLIRGEFAMLFHRLGLKMDDKADINATYRALCGRSPCNQKLAFFCDKFEQYYMYKNPENRLLTNLDYFDKISAMAILDGWKRIWIYDIAHAFNLDSTDTKMDNPVNVV
uniref:Uncharacterized protein n=1 Tax=Panagrolaimus sp. PS1159 TaxID=55785 RepID=A0AC35GL32_9BILA